MIMNKLYDSQMVGVKDLDTITTSTNLEELSESDKVKVAYANILEFITNTFYRNENNDEIHLEISNKGEGENYYDRFKIVLSSQLMDIFGEMNLPRFLIYYHELGHHLYSHGMFRLEGRWRTISTGPLTYSPKYKHLLNWIEDFFIEDQLKKDHSYLTDVIDCIKKLPVEYDINRIEYVFNFWYLYQAASPALTYVDQLTFAGYLKKLLKIRSSNPINFGAGILTTVSIKRSKETEFTLLLIEFYNWCVSKGIFSPDDTLEELTHPTNYISIDAGDNNDVGTDEAASIKPEGSYSDHSGTVGKAIVKKQRPMISNPTNMLQEIVTDENTLVHREIINMYERLQTQKKSLVGLFTTLYEPSALIQNKVIVPNFFNPNRIIDQVLFLEKQHAYTNVAIFRDVSGSTSSYHSLFHEVCELLYEEIPVAIDYYLYSSGNVSILKIPYLPWKEEHEPPSEYKQDSLFNQLGGGTNSDAIADVITEQFSDKWINIVITDGDLDRLMERDNIYALLKNVFVISIKCDVEKGLKGIRVDSTSDLVKIVPELASIKDNLA